MRAVRRPTPARTGLAWEVTPTYTNKLQRGTISRCLLGYSSLDRTLLTATMWSCVYKVSRRIATIIYLTLRLLMPLPNIVSRLSFLSHAITPLLFRLKYRIRCCGMNSSSVCSDFHASSALSLVPKNRSS